VRCEVREDLEEQDRLESIVESACSVVGSQEGAIEGVMEVNVGGVSRLGGILHA
jgi:hypothetical protein